MLFPHNKLTDEITRKQLLEIKDADRERRMAYYQRRYNIYKGIITDPNESGYDRSLCKEFFPAGKNETDDEYDERMKVWIPQGVIVLNRLVDLALKGSVVYKFESIEEGKNEELAELATKAYEKTLEYNNWEIIARERLIESLAIGQISDWFDYRRHDPQTGQEFDFGGRVRFVKFWPWFAEPIVSPDNVTEIIGAAQIYIEEGDSITNAVSLQMSLDGKRKLVTKLWLDPLYDVETGKNISKGKFVRFEDEKVVMPAGKEDWISNNKYALTPVVFWQSPDIDESQYNGESFFDRFLDTWLKLCRVASNEVSGLQYIINQWYVIAAKEATPKDLPIRHNAVHKIPQGEPQSQIGVNERNLDLTPEAAVKQYLTSTIGEAGSYSADLLSVEGAGKIAESGIARKIVYEKTVDAVRMIRRNFCKGKCELMTKTLRVLLYENDGKIDGKKIDMRLLRPVISFDDNIMPVSELEALELNIMRRDNKIITEEEFIMLENVNIKTMAQAEEHLKKINEARAKLEPPMPPPEQKKTFIRRDATKRLPDTAQQ